MPVARRFIPEQRWIFFGLAGLTLLMFSIDWTIVAVALPTLIDDLHTQPGLGRLDADGVRADPDGDDAAGRQAGRAVRPDAGLPGLRVPVHARLAAVRAGAEHLRPDRLPRAPGAWRRRVPAVVLPGSWRAVPRDAAAG